MSTKYLNYTGLSYFWDKIKVYVASLLSAKADDSDVVHIAGTETVTGAKTFLDTVTAPRFDGAVSMYDLDAPTTDSIDGTIPPAYYSLMDVTRSCKTAFMPADNITIEYSIDGGSTWIAYGASDSDKQNLFAMTNATTFQLGKGSSGGNSAMTTNCKLRVTLLSTGRYVSVDTLYTYVCAFNHTMYVDVEHSTVGNPTTFSIVRSGIRVSGWSGPNIASLPKKSFGSYNTSQTDRSYAYRFIFYCTSIGRNTTSYPTVSDIRLYGNTTWTSANSMMFRDHLYSWDYAQNATFPANVIADTFIGALTGNAASASAVAWSGITGKPTTISGYGITDAKIQNGTITLGSNTITPLTEDSVKVAASASRSADIAVNGTYTVPSYIVGKQQLLVYLDGCLSRQGDGWSEVGTAGAASTTIKFLQLIPKAMEIVVRVN